MMFVIDASVAASWCFPDEASPAADAALRRLAEDSALIPSLFWFELRNVLLIGERRRRIAETDTARFLGFVRDLPLEIDPDPDGNLVLGLARTHRLSFYDAIYLELAQRKVVPLATLDGELIAAAKAEKVPLIGEGA
ncbi:MAG: type II toxin-antitoxin system VapC family toxin [Alphaproteobacteria bacterium]|nr:type II toxin-antitoxin system VapC family toxin [Alphaproteobacteria bacterium]